ncbi:MAG: hypothetical protein LWW96_11470 [Acidovorax sp.]|uniref:hypothetical protein n=1 Tax=Acidovorax sp. TaxID=1872122 RepID=UPI0025C682A1|nr:hypothetical protein [Acidovorax sp.]MCE1192760.1 hypothetical protein [Acidovorax sp.]
MQHRDLELFADYHQFYLQDELASGDLSDAWTDEAVERLLALAPGIVGVGTASNGNIPVAVEVLEGAPAESWEPYDQVNECSLAIAHGPLVVAGWTEYFPEAARIPLAPGIYRVRISYCLFGEERYLVQLWQAPRVEPLVVKARAA